MLLHDCGLDGCVDSHLKATSLITLATECAGEQDECVNENPRTRAANDGDVYKKRKDRLSTARTNITCSCAVIW